MAAAAQRLVYLEPEEPQQLDLQLPQRKARRAQAASVARIRPLPMLVGFVSIVAVLIFYIAGNACIARQELRRQALVQQMAQLERERVQNILTLDRLAAQPRVIQLAQLQGLEQPTINRIHFVRVAEAYPGMTVAQTRPSKSNSWLARSKGQVMTALLRLSRGPGDPASIPE